MNGGDTGSWEKKPTAPDNCKRAVSKKKTVEKVSSKKFCQKCALQGIQSPIRLFQINDDEAILMCKNVDCTFMPTSNWTSLIIKRNISQLCVSRNKKRSASSTSSVSSLSIHSAPQISGQSPLDPYNKLTSSGGKKSANLKRGSSSSCLTGQRSFAASPTPSEESEKKTLVPFAPFLSGSAHIFPSFETNRLEDKRKKSGNFNISPTGLDRYSSALKRKVNSGIDCFSALRSNRRRNSLESDSVSSSSCSSNSRSTSPIFEGQVGKVQLPVNKVKSISVPPDTWSKLQDGSRKVQVNDKNDGSIIFFNSASDSSKDVQLNPAEPSLTGTTCDILKSESVTATDSFDITPIGYLPDILKSVSSQSSSSVDGESIKSHIDAINKHLFALKSLGAGNALPLALVNLSSNFKDTSHSISCSELQVTVPDSVNNENAVLSPIVSSESSPASGLCDINNLDFYNQRGSRGAIELDDYFLDNI